MSIEERREDRAKLVTMARDLSRNSATANPAQYETAGVIAFGISVLCEHLEAVVSALQAR